MPQHFRPHLFVKPWDHPVKPESVTRARAGVTGKEGFDTVEELLTEHLFTAAETFIEN